MKTIYQIAIVLIATTILNAQPAHNEQILSSSGGDAVAMHKDNAIISDMINKKVHFKDMNYTTMLWQDNSTITETTLADYGISVAVSNDIAVVGAPYINESDGELYAFKGGTGGNKNKEFYKGTDSWNLDTPFPSTISAGASLVSVGSDSVYGIIGGNGGGQQDSFERYDKSTGVWNLLLGALNKLGAGADMSYNGKDTIYVIEGVQKVQGSTITGSKKLMKYSISANSWTEIGTNIIPQEVKTGGSLNYYQTASGDEQLVVIPGGDSTQTHICTLGGTSTSCNWQIITGSHTVSIGSDSDISLIDNHLYHMVGDGTLGNDTSIFQRLDMEDVAAGWESLAVVPKDIGSGGSLAIAGSQIYVLIGGGTEVWIYDISADTWTQDGAGPDVGQGGALTFSPKKDLVYIYTKQSDGTWTNDANISLDLPGLKDEFGYSVGVEGNATNAQIVVGAPNALDSSTLRGKVYAYSWDGSTATLNTTLKGISTHSKKFGTSLDIKGDYLIVGAPDEEGIGDPLAGAAYTFKFDGSGWVDHPGTGYRRIKLDEPNKHLGTYVAINKDGNVTMVGEETTGQPESRIFTNSGAAWSQSHLHAEGFKSGVDIDDGVYMFARGDNSFNYFEFHDSPSGSVLFKAHASNSVVNAFSSVSLYKDQIIGNRPDNNEALIMDIPCGIKPTHLKANEWAMVSVPCGDGTATITQLFGDDMGSSNTLCTTDNPNEDCNWSMYKDGPNYTGKARDYVIVGANEAMALGQGYWIAADHDVTLKVDGDSSVPSGVTTRTALSRTTNVSELGGYYDVSLPNMVSGEVKKIMMGNPFPRAFKWSDLELDHSGSVAQFPSGIYHPTGYVYDTTQSGQPYRAITAGTPGVSDEIKPYQGFWIKDLAPSNISNIKLGIAFEK